MILLFGSTKAKKHELNFLNLKKAQKHNFLKAQKHNLIFCKVQNLKKHENIFFQAKTSSKIISLIPGCPSSSLHAQNFSWMYQSGNNYENQVTNGEHSSIF